MADQLTMTQDFRERIVRVEESLRQHEETLVGAAADELCPVKHHFAHGFYMRELRCPAGVLAVTKIHRTAHPFFLMQGSVSILTEHGIERIEASYAGITAPGTKRVVYTHTDTVWLTVHEVDAETDLEAIEARLIAEDFAALELDEATVAQMIEDSWATSPLYSLSLGDSTPGSSSARLRASPCGGRWMPSGRAFLRQSARRSWPPRRRTRRTRSGPM